MPPRGVAAARGRGCSDSGELWSDTSVWGARLGKPGDRQNGCGGGKEEVHGLELPWRTAEQAF